MRLRHHAVVGGDDEQSVLAAGDAGHHVVDEAVVAGHVHEADPLAVEVRVRETKVYGEAAAFLLGEPIGVDAGERPHDGRFAVVDVPGEGDDHALLKSGAVPLSRRSRSCARTSIHGTSSDLATSTVSLLGAWRIDRASASRPAMPAGGAHSPCSPARRRPGFRETDARR